MCIRDSNDTLSAIVAELVHADALIMMTDIEGLYNSDPVPYTHLIIFTKIIIKNKSRIRYRRRGGGRLRAAIF